MKIAFLSKLFKRIVAFFSPDALVEKNEEQSVNNATMLECSLNTCLIIDDIRWMWFNAHGQYPPMVYFDKHTNSLCLEYHYKELQTGDILGIMFMFPMFYNNKGILAVRDTVGCRKHCIMIKHDFHFTPVKKPRKDSASANKLMMFRSEAVMDISTRGVIDADGTVRTEETIIMMTDRCDIHNAVMNCAGVACMKMIEYFPTQYQLDDANVAPMIYCEQYDTVFDNVPEILQKEARIDSGIRSALPIILTQQ